MVAINTNIASLLAQNNTRQVNNELEKAMERLSSGLRINSAGDDAAGLAIASRMESQVRGLQAAIKNANDGISVTQVAEGAMDEVGNILQRMRELAVQSANDSNSDADRAYLQEEVAQLAEEITRISETTQFNGQNILDGSYTDKYFQIGANASQNVGLSIANLAADALGIGAITTSTSTSSTTTSTAVTEEVARLEFAFDDTYSFKLTDRDTGLNYQIQGSATTAASGNVSVSADTITITDHGLRTGDEVSATGTTTYTGTMFVIKVDEDTIQLATSKGNATNGTAADNGTANAVTITPSALTLNLEDAQSKADFEDRINIGLKESAVNTTVTGYGTSDAQQLYAQATASTVLDLTSVDSDHFQFTLTVDGETQDVDFLNRAMAAATTDSAASFTEIVTGMRNAIQSTFDDSLSVTHSSGVFTIEDAQGRSLSVEQGSGSGFFFGTDTQNSGSIDVDANVANNLSVGFDDSDLVISHAAAGGVDLTNYTAATSTTYNVFSASTGSSSSLTEPVILTNQTAGVSTSMLIQGEISESKIALNFSDTFGYGSDGATANSDLSATYSFQITDGAGNIYIDASSGLDIQELNNTDATIEAYINARILSSALADTLITADEFDVDYTGGVLTITNSVGRELAVENFSSAYGKVTVSKLDGLEGSEELSSQQALTSEFRLTRGFGTTLTAATAIMTIALDGATAQTVDISSAFDASTSSDTGWEQAGLIEAALQTAFTDTNLRVAYDSENDQFAISDVLGRELNFSAFATSEPVGQVIVETGEVAQANKANTVATSTTAVSGVMTEAASLKLTFSQDTLTSTGFTLNGVALTAASFNFETDTFAGSTFETNLDQLMTTLNAGYDGQPISYAMDEASRAITLTHSKGGELQVSAIATSNASLTIGAEVLSGKGDSNSTLALYETLTSASIEGDGTVDGVATVSSSSSSSTSVSSTGISQISIASQEGANSALSSIDAALSTVLSERSKLGALENRLDHTINNLSNIATNTSAAKSRVMDADFAVETANLTKNQILSQAATSMLAQANQSKQSILALLQ